MAKQVETTVSLIDDFDGTKAVETIAWSIDGNQYELDLSAKNAREMRKLLAPYAEVSRRARQRRQRKNRSVDLSAIRNWANSHGYTVADRGRIPVNVVEAYEAAN